MSDPAPSFTVGSPPVLAARPTLAVAKKPPGSPAGAKPVAVKPAAAKPAVAKPATTLQAVVASIETAPEVSLGFSAGSPPSSPSPLSTSAPTTTTAAPAKPPAFGAKPVKPAAAAGAPAKPGATAPVKVMKKPTSFGTPGMAFQGVVNQAVAKSAPAGTAKSAPVNQGPSQKTATGVGKLAAPGSVATGGGGFSTLRKKWEHTTTSAQSGGVSDAKIVMCEKYNLQSLLKLWRNSIVKVQSGAYEVIENLIETQNGLAMTPSKLNGFRPLVDITKNYEDEIQLNAVWALAKLAGFPDCRLQIMTEVGWHNIRKFMAAPEQEMVMACSLLLANLSKEKNNQQGIIEKGVPMLMEKLKNDSTTPALKGHILSALADITVIKEYGAKPIWDFDLLPIVLPAVLDDQNPNIQHPAVTIVKNITQDSPNTHEQVIKSGAMEVMIGQLGDHENPDLIADITLAISYLAKSDAAIREIETLHGYRAIINLLDSTNVGVQHGVICAISTLADSALSGSSLKRDGVIEPLKELIFATPSLEVEELALQALYKLDSEAWRVTTLRLESEGKKNRTGNTYIPSADDKKKAEENRLKYEADKAAKSAAPSAEDEAARLRREEEDRKRKEELKRQEEERKRQSDEEKRKADEDKRRNQADLEAIQNEKKKHEDDLKRIADEKKKREEEDAKAEEERRKKMDAEKQQHTAELQQLEAEKQRKAAEAKAMHEEAERRRAEMEEKRKQDEEKYRREEAERAEARRKEEEEFRKQQDAERQRLEALRRKEREESMLIHRSAAEADRQRQEDAERKAMLDRLAKEEELHRAKMAQDAAFEEERRKFAEEKRRFEAEKVQQELLQKQREDEYKLQNEKDRIEKEIEARKKQLEEDRLAEERRRLEARLKEEQDKFKRLQADLEAEKESLKNRRNREGDADKAMMNDKMRELQDMLDREKKALAEERARLEKIQRSMNDDDKLRLEKLGLEHEIELQKLQAEKKRLALEKEELQEELEREKKKHERQKREMELDNEIRATKDQFAQDKLIRDKIDKEMKALRDLMSANENGSLEEEKQKIQAWKDALEAFQKEKIQFEADKADWEERKVQNKEYDRNIADLDQYILDKERAKLEAEKNRELADEESRRMGMSGEIEKLRQQLDDESKRNADFRSKRGGGEDDDYDSRLRELAAQLALLQKMLDDERRINEEMREDQGKLELDNERLVNELQRALDELRRRPTNEVSDEEKKRLEEEKQRLADEDEAQKKYREELEQRREAIMALLDSENNGKLESADKLDIFLKLSKEAGFEDLVKQMQEDRDLMKQNHEELKNELKKLEEWREEKRKADEDMRRGFNPEFERMKEKRLSVQRNEAMAMADIVAREKALDDREAKLKASEAEVIAAKALMRSPPPRYEGKQGDGTGRDRSVASSDSSDYDSSRSRSRARGEKKSKKGDRGKSSRSRSRDRSRSRSDDDSDYSRSRTRSEYSRANGKRYSDDSRSRSPRKAPRSGKLRPEYSESDMRTDFTEDPRTDNSEFYDEINDKLAERSRGGYLDTGDDFDGGFKAVDDEDEIAFSVEGLAVSDPHKAARQLLRAMAQDNTRSIPANSVETLRKFAKMRSGDPSQTEARELIPVLMNVLSVYNDPNHADVIATALLILAILAYNKESNQLFILKAHGGPVFFRLLSFGVPNVRARAALAIAAYCLNNTYIKREMSKSIPRLVQMFQTSSEENVKKGTSAALAALADDYKHNQNKIRSKGGVRALLLHVANNQLPPRYALHLLSAVSRKNSSVQNEVSDTYPDVFRKIVRLLSPFSKPYILSAAVASLTELARKNGSNQRAVYKAGALPYLVTVLTSGKHNHNHELIGNALFLIWAIAKRIGVTSPDFRSPAGGALPEIIAPLKEVAKNNEAVRQLITNIENMLRAPSSHAE